MASKQTDHANNTDNNIPLYCLIYKQQSETNHYVLKTRFVWRWSDHLFSNLLKHILITHNQLKPPRMVRATITSSPSHVNSNPKQKEEDAETHEEWSNQRDEQFFVYVSCVFCGCYLIAGADGG